MGRGKVPLEREVGGSWPVLLGSRQQGPEFSRAVGTGVWWGPCQGWVEGPEVLARSIPVAPHWPDAKPWVLP